MFGILKCVSKLCAVCVSSVSQLLCGERPPEEAFREFKSCVLLSESFAIFADLVVPKGASTLGGKVEKQTHGRQNSI